MTEENEEEDERTKETDSKTIIRVEEEQLDDNSLQEIHEKDFESTYQAENLTEEQNPNKAQREKSALSENNEKVCGSNFEAKSLILNLKSFPICEDNHSHSVDYSSDKPAAMTTETVQDKRNSLNSLENCSVAVKVDKGVKEKRGKGGCGDSDIVIKGSRGSLWENETVSSMNNFNLTHNTALLFCGSKRDKFVSKHHVLTSTSRELLAINEHAVKSIDLKTAARNSLNNSGKQIANSYSGSSCYQPLTVDVQKQQISNCSRISTIRRIDREATLATEDMRSHSPIPNYRSVTSDVAVAASTTSDTGGSTLLEEIEAAFVARKCHGDRRNRTGRGDNSNIDDEITKYEETLHRMMTA